MIFVKKQIFIEKRFRFRYNLDFWQKKYFWDLPVFEFFRDSFCWVSFRTVSGQFSNGFETVLFASVFYGYFRDSFCWVSFRTVSVQFWLASFRMDLGQFCLHQFSTDTFGQFFWVTLICEIFRMMKFFKISKFSINGKVFTCFIDLLLMIICLVYVNTVYILQEVYYIPNIFRFFLF